MGMEQQAVKKTPVVIETRRYQIVGNVSVPDGTRLSDYANDGSRAFFAITEVQYAPLEQLERTRNVEFMLVNRLEVSVMLPAWDEQTGGEGQVGSWALEDFMFDGNPATT
jgi:hypothetical protein